MVGSWKGTEEEEKEEAEGHQTSIYVWGREQT